MKNATMFYIHPGKKKLHGINVNTVIADALNDNVVSDLLAQGYRRSPREALAAYQEAQKPVVNGPTASPPAPQADEAPAVAPEPTQEPETAPMPTIGDLLRDIERSPAKAAPTPTTVRRPGRPKKVK